MLKVTDLRVGKNIILDNMPYEIMEYSHSKVARGGAIVKAKLKSLTTGAIVENNFKGHEKIEEAPLEYISSQFLYSDADEFHFMDQETYNQFSLSKNLIGTNSNFIKEGDIIDVTFLKGNPISIKLPIKIDFKVTETEPGVKGDTASSANKEAKIETGFILQVPLFIKEGDKIRIDTRDGKYVERVTG